LFEKDSELAVIKQTNEQLLLEVDSLRSGNRDLSVEVARLIEVDQELVKAKEKIREIQQHAEDEVAAKEFLVRTL